MIGLVRTDDAAYAMCKKALGRTPYLEIEPNRAEWRRHAERHDLDALGDLLAGASHVLHGRGATSIAAPDELAQVASRYILGNNKSIVSIPLLVAQKTTRDAVLGLLPSTTRAFELYKGRKMLPSKDVTEALRAARTPEEITNAVQHALGEFTRYRCNVIVCGDARLEPYIPKGTHVLYPAKLLGQTMKKMG